jgi:hypothetical protein
VKSKEGRPVWRFERFPIMDPAGNPMWPDIWPADRIETRRAELSATPFEFARQMMCQARDDEDAYFKRDWVDECLERGDGLEYPFHLDPADLPLGATIWTGVDLSTGKNADRGDLTAMVHLLRYASGELLLLGVEAGRWRAPEIARRLAEVRDRYKGTIYVEEAGQQLLLIDLVRNQGIPIRAFGTTGKSKALIIQAVASELANGRIILPNVGGKVPESVDSLIHDVLYYVPDQHTGDRLMALAIAVAASRRMGRVAKTTEIQTFRTGVPEQAPAKPSAPGRVDTGLTDDIFDQGD